MELGNSSMETIIEHDRRVSKRIKSVYEIDHVVFERGERKLPDCFLEKKSQYSFKRLLEKWEREQDPQFRSAKKVGDYYIRNAKQIFENNGYFDEKAMSKELGIPVKEILEITKKLGLF